MRGFFALGIIWLLNFFHPIHGFTWKDEVALSIVNMLQDYLQNEHTPTSRFELYTTLIASKTFVEDNLDREMEEEFSEEALIQAIPGLESYISRNYNTRKLIEFPSARGLDGTCSNKLCRYIEYELSCKTIGINFDKICSRYLLGTMYGCDIFPTGYQKIYEAPSSCLDQYVSVLTLLQEAAGGSSSALMDAFAKYLFEDFDNNACGRECYQKFQNHANEFFLGCQSQLNASATHYPLVSVLSSFQYFRNNACGRNGTDFNCYVYVTELLQQISSGTGGVNLFDFTCNYFGDDTFNSYVLAGVCDKFTKLGCCAGTVVELITQNQMNTSNLSIFPPCLLNFLRDNCNTANMENLCSNGSIATQSLIQGTIYLPNSATHYIDVYNKTSVFYAQAIISGILEKLGFYPQPYYLYSKYPFKVKIVGYRYYNESELLTPHYTIPTTYDYDESTAGNFTYQIVLMNLNKTQEQTLQATLASTTFKYAVMQAFGDSTFATTTTTQSEAATFDKNELEVDNGNSDSDDHVLPPAALTVVLVVIALTIFGVIFAFNNNLYGKLFPKKQPQKSTAHM